jgi:hypothetical protein
MAMLFGIWDSLTPEPQAKVTSEETELIEKNPSDTIETQTSDSSDSVTRIDFKDDSDCDLREVIATIFEREENSTGSPENDSGHDLKDYSWESISACSSKGVPLSKNEIHEIFGGMSPLEIFSPDVDPFEGEDFRYQGRSLRRVRLTKVSHDSLCQKI